jgi:hypothetical protein
MEAAMNIITSEAEPDPTGNDREGSRGTGGGRESAGARGGRRARPEIYDAERCLQLLSQLSVLLMMGLITPAKANAVRANLTALLQHYQHQESRAGGRTVADDDLQEIVGRDPRLLELLEPFLSDAQIDLLMQRGGEADDE